MTFLTPIAAITAGLIATPVLIALYLLKLRRRPVRVGSTMLWEQAVRDVQVNVPFRWLRPSWLLLLHLLILALFVLALGRPVLEGPTAAGARVFLVIDRSASMAVADMPGDRTRLNAALARAGELADELASGATPEITVVTYADSAELAGRPARSASEVRAQLAGIRQTDQGADPRAALELVSALIPPETDESESPDPALVVLLTDGGSIDRAMLALPGAEFRYERFAGDSTDNAGITELAGSRDRDDPALVRVYVGLGNAGAQPIAVPIAVRVGGDVVERAAIRVPAADVTDGARTLGETGRTFALRLPDAALIEVEIERDDLLDADNRAAMAVPPARRPAILVVAPGEGDTAAPDPFLVEDVLGTYPTRQLRVVTLGAYERLIGSVGAFDVVVFDRVSPGSVPPRPAMYFGAAPPGVGRSAPVGGTTPITRWARSHPLMADITLDALLVGQRRVFDTTPPDGSPFGTVTPLAWTGEGPVIVELARGSERSIAVGFSVAQSNWPVQVSFPIFVAGSIERLAPRAGAAAGIAWTTADAIRIDAPAGAREVVLTGPAELRGEADAPGGAADLGVPERAGVYRIAGVPGPLGAVPVNLASAEETVLGGAEEVTLAGVEATSEAGERAGMIELWPWLIGIASVLLMIDWVLYAMLMRA
ncbi:MAG: BatA domain-containing protein [Phycisphaerales bacterium]